MTVRFSAAARRDRREAESYYQAVSPAVRAAFRRELEHALQFVLDYPQGAPVRVRDIRAKRLAHFPYTVLYRLIEEHVFVLAIASQLRDPDFYSDLLS